MSFPSKIDVHHHSLPSFYCEAVAKSIDVSGAPAPGTTIQDSINLMDKLDVSTSIISLSAPGAEIAGSVEGSRALARQYNDYAYAFRASDPTRLGFFAALPSLNDMEGCIAEIKYALDEQRADGVTLFSSYGGKYLGHPDLIPLWFQLNARRAVVFIHPTHTPSGEWASPSLQQPIIDYPHETTRTACDLIMSGRKRQNPKCKIILSHGGGTLPFLAERLRNLAPTIFAKSQVQDAPKGEEIVDDAKSFYFDTALASTANILDSLLKWAPKEQILFGSDFPFAFNETIEFYTEKLEDYEMDDQARQMLYRNNALELFPRLRN